MRACERPRGVRGVVELREARTLAPSRIGLQRARGPSPAVSRRRSTRRRAAVSIGILIGLVCPSQQTTAETVPVGSGGRSAGCHREHNAAAAQPGLAIARRTDAAVFSGDNGRRERLATHPCCLKRRRCGAARSTAAYVLCASRSPAAHRVRPSVRALRIAIACRPRRPAVIPPAPLCAGPSCAGDLAWIDGGGCSPGVLGRVCVVSWVRHGAS